MRHGGPLQAPRADRGAPAWAAGGHADCLCRIRVAPVPRLPALLAPLVDPRPAPAPRRRRIWDLGSSLHCSIIGTCLSTDDLHRLLRKLGLGQASDADHVLHGIGVGLALRQDQGSKLLNKALDDRHRAAIRRFDAARDQDAVGQLWRQAVEAGEIPGAYWALLTHPAADQPLIARAFGEVHMLSHLVGAANRADIRRLAVQDREIAALQALVARQQARLQADLTERDGRIRALQDMLVRQATAAPTAASGDDGAEFGTILARLQRRADREAQRREAAEMRGRLAEAALRAEQASRRALESEAGRLALELAAAEVMLEPAQEAERPAPPGRRATVLYVGGRSGQTALLRQAAARCAAELLHHDAEQGAALLPGLVGRVDLVVFPVDCVSHDAALSVKRLCRQAGRPFTPLRTSGVGSLLAALSGRG